MSLPKHRNPTNSSREAKAPYNFVPLPKAIETVAADELPDHDRYYPANRYTGRIECILTTSSPMYIRCGQTPDDFSKDKQSPEFFTDPVTVRPVIPGSSLRGMLRSMVEIVSYGKVQPVSSRKLFFRAVADKMTTLRDAYNTQMELVKAGYVNKFKDVFSIIPANELGTQETFFKVKEKIVREAGLPEFVSLELRAYKPTRIACSFQLKKFQDKKTKKTGFMVTAIDLPAQLPYEGTLICSGKMKGKRNHWIVNRRGNVKQSILIEEKLVKDYQETMSDFEKEHFDKSYGCLQEGQPVFYLEQDGKVVAFGHTRNFRVPYWDNLNKQTLSPQDFVPQPLRDIDITDISEAMFGYVESASTTRPTTRAGRIFVSDATMNEYQQDIWLAGNAGDSITPQILSGPKPTTFSHYLVQQQPDRIPYRDKTGRSQSRLDLAHYATSTPSKTVIRGHKLYWHKGKNPSIALENSNKVSETQKTEIKPLRSGVSFTFNIRFENLNDLELGAILWVLNLGADPEYRLKLGMGKPLGMGAVKTEATLHLTDRTQRYTSLFDGDSWQLGPRSDNATVAEHAVHDFEDHIRANHADAFGGDGRIEQLKALLKWPGPTPEETRYMTIQPNEYKDRKVLPTPLKVLENNTPSGRQSHSGSGDNRQIEQPPPPARPQPQSKYKVGKEVQGKVVGTWKKGKVEVEFNGDKGVLKESKKRVDSIGTQTVTMVIEAIKNGQLVLKFP